MSPSNGAKAPRRGTGATRGAPRLPQEIDSKQRKQEGRRGSFHQEEKEMGNGWRCGASLLIPSLSLSLQALAFSRSTSSLALVVFWGPPKTSRPVLPPSPLPSCPPSPPTGPASQGPSCPMSPRSGSSQGPPSQTPCSQGPGGPPVTRPFPGLPLLAGLGQGAGERLRLLSLRPQGLEVKPCPIGAQGHLDPREVFSSEIHRPKTGDKSPVSPQLGNFKAVWPLDPP